MGSVAEKKYPLKLVGGWWYVWTGNVKGTVSFDITEEDGSHVRLSDCFGGWEHRKAGQSCSGAQQNLLLQSSVDGNFNLTETSLPEAAEEPEEATMPVYP